MPKKINETLKEKYVSAMMEQVENSDTECAHGTADDLLCEMLNELGYHEVVEKYERVSKWYA